MLSFTSGSEQTYALFIVRVRAVASGVKGGDDYRGPRLRGGPPGDLNRLTEASLKRRSGQLTGHCCASSRKLIICTCFFFVINNFLFLFFHKQHNIISKIKQNKTADTYSTSQGSIKREGEREGQQEHKSYSFK